MREKLETYVVTMVLGCSVLLCLFFAGGGIVTALTHTNPVVCVVGGITAVLFFAFAGIGIFMIWELYHETK